MLIHAIQTYLDGAFIICPGNVNRKSYSPTLFSQRDNRAHKISFFNGPRMLLKNCVIGDKNCGLFIGIGLLGKITADINNRQTTCKYYSKYDKCMSLNELNHNHSFFHAKTLQWFSVALTIAYFHKATMIVANIIASLANSESHLRRR